MTTRVVLVGAGKVGASYAADPVMARHYRYASHAQVLAEHPDLEWGGVVDADANVARQVAERWGVPRHGTSVAAVCDAYAPDLAVLATPPADRLATLSALPRLRAVLVEKPLGRDEPESRAFLEAARARDVLVQVNLWRRADARTRELAATLSERLGDVQAVQAFYGNGLHNNGTHMVDVVRLLFGEIASVRSVPESLRDAHGPIPGDVHVHATLVTTSGVVVALVPLDFRAYRENGLDVWGTTGRLTVLQEGLSTDLYPRVENRAMSGEREIASDAPSRLAPTCGDAFWAMYQNVLDALAGRAELVSPGESALRSAHVVDLVERSAREGGRALATHERP